MARERPYSALARYYDRVYASKDYAKETREILRFARTAGGRPIRSVLDMACGTGHHLAMLPPSIARAGVDCSPAMLRIARGRLGRSASLYRGDMRTVRLHRTFDAVFCLFSAIGYLLTSRDREAAFANFYRHLVPGGVAVIEGWIVPQEFRPNTVHLLTYNGDDAKIARVTTSSRAGTASVMRMYYLAAEAGRPVRSFEEEHRMALVEPTEALRSREHVGFHARARKSPSYPARRILIAVRPGL